MNTKANRPFPVDIEAYLSSDTIASLTLEQEAIFWRLVFRQWRSPDGTIPKDEDVLARSARIASRARWRKVGRPVIQKCFIERNGGWINPRCDRERRRADARSRKARIAARLRWNGQEED